MKKLFLIFFVSFAFLFLISGTTQAAGPLCDDSSGGTIGLVPCGLTSGCRCELGHVFLLIKNVFNFIVFKIATPLAGLMIVIGGVMLVVSAGNPGYVSQGKHIILWSIIAWLLIFASWIIIDTVLRAIGAPPLVQPPTTP